jgi:hypothetical protein
MQARKLCKDEGIILHTEKVTQTLCSVKRMSSAMHNGDCKLSLVIKILITILNAIKLYVRQ